MAGTIEFCEAEPGFDVYVWSDGRHSGDRLGTFDTHDEALAFAREYAIAHKVDMVVRKPAQEVVYADYF